MDFYSRYKEEALSRYPSSKEAFKNENWRNSVSEQVISFPHSILSKMEQTVSAITELKRSDFYKNFLKDSAPFPLNHSQNSLLMAYDFHLNSEEDLKLIEVNTNASGFLISELVFASHGFDSKSLNSLQRSFETEWKNFKKQNSFSIPRKVFIIDKDPFQQKMFMEFLMYKDFLNSFSWETYICDSQDLIFNSKKELVDSQQRVVDFVYNRTTDFYFKNHPHLEEAYRSQACCLSPNPSDYYLLADKKRLCDWFECLKTDSLSKATLSSLQKILLPTWNLTPENRKHAWENKKNYFFKPLQSFGGKQAYRGKSLTRSRFEEISREPFLFQEYCPPSLTRDGKDQKWKFDLRAFTYGEEIQQVVARLYQGQVTNFHSFGGGFAAVRFS